MSFLFSDRLKKKSFNMLIRLSVTGIRNQADAAWNNCLDALCCNVI